MNDSLLHVAAEEGNLDVVQYLVEQGLDVNAKDDSGFTVLHFVVMSGNLDFIKWFV